MTSLTLTNPDMILPDNGREHESRTPSPPSLTYLSQLNARHGFQNGSNAAPSMVAPRAKKNFSRPNWSGHEDVNTSGRRLSDIGEELSPARVGGFADGSGGDEGNPRSSSSGSEYSKQSTPQNGQTDVAKGETTEQAGQTGLPGSNAMASAAVEGKGPGDEVSSAILSSEAERILENAKKRLTVCEDAINWLTEWLTLSRVAYGRQSQPGSLDGEGVALALAHAFAFSSGSLIAGSSAWWAVSIDISHRPKRLWASPAVDAVVAGPLEQSTFAGPQRDQLSLGIKPSS